MTEHSEQVALFEWAAWQANLGEEPLRWMFAIPNGGLRHKATAGRLKAEGVKAGICDIMLPSPTQQYAGLFIEMKIKPNQATADQLEYMKWLNDAGYLAVIADGFEEAKGIIMDYLDKGA